MKHLAYFLSVIIFLGLVVMPSHADTNYDKDLTSTLGTIFFDCQKIKPGMTRADLEKMFKRNTGGVAVPESETLPFQEHQTFEYRKSSIVNIQVDFSPSDSKMERPTDIITKVSLPYLYGGPKE